MWKMQPRFAVRLGGNTYINTPNLIVYEGAPIFRIRHNSEDGMIEIGFQVFDKGGNRVATFARGAVSQGDASIFDIQSGADTYSVTERSTGRVIARVQRRGPNQLDVHVHMYLPDGFLLDAGPERSNLGGAVLTGNVFEDCYAGITIS